MDIGPWGIGSMVSAIAKVLHNAKDTTVCNVLFLPSFTMPNDASKSYKKLNGPDRQSFNETVKKLPKGQQKKLAKVAKGIVKIREQLTKAVRRG